MKDRKLQNNATEEAQNKSVSRRNVLLASTALAAASAIPAAEMAQAQKKPAAQPKPAAQTAPAQSGQRPNILVIFGDDIGLANISAYSMGLMGYRTPNIDRIAKEGMIFTDYYAEQSCTAGRSTFLTGQCTLRTGLSKVGMPGATAGLQARDATIAELLKPLGYSSGQFGKNHLGERNEYLPTVHGFDEFFGNLYHLNAEEDPEDFNYPRGPPNSASCLARAACSGARRRTGTIRPNSRAGAESASKRLRTPAH
jgi:arylsulfatase A-like enzyme